MLTILFNILMFFFIAWLAMGLVGLGLRWWLSRKIKGFQDNMSQAFNPRAQQKSHASSQTQAAHDMVQCRTCGTYILRARALTRSGQYYCCEAHLQD